MMSTVLSSPNKYQIPTLNATNKGSE